RDSGFDVNLELTLGRLYLGARDYSKAIVSLRNVVEDQPEYPEAAMLLAAAQEGSGQKADQIRTLEMTLENNPTFYRGALRLAELYEQDRRYTEAADAYARAAAANSRIDVSTQRAAALVNAGKAGEARDILEAAIKKS